MSGPISLGAQSTVINDDGFGRCGWTGNNYIGAKKELFRQTVRIQESSVRLSFE